CRERCRGSLPAVAAIQQQGAGARCLEARRQCREVDEAAEPSVSARRVREIEGCERVSVARPRSDGKRLEKMLADEVWRPARRLSNAEIHVGLAEMHRSQLRVAIGDVE